MKRLFTFGCSYTRYRWPTWPWMMLDNFDIVYNYGRGGAGNEYIFHTLVEAMKEHDISSNDTVIIMWSTYPRLDLYLENGVVTHGNIFNSQHTKDFIQKSWSFNGAMYKTWTYISAATMLLQGKNITFAYSSLYLDEHLSRDESLPDHLQSAVPGCLVTDNLDQFCSPDVDAWRGQRYRGMTMSYKFSYDFGLPVYDGHPSIEVMCTYVSEILKPKLLLDPAQWMIDTAMRVDAMIKSVDFHHTATFNQILFDSVTLYPNRYHTIHVLQLDTWNLYEQKLAKYLDKIKR